MKFLILLIRLFVAVTFIFSGFVKLVDPIGTKIKMLEYFDVLNLNFLSAYALPISVLLILLEFALGIWLLLGYKPKLTLKSLLILSFVFLFLTWYSAYFNKVTDCGCFGDAIKLTPWETFYKNVVLTALIVFLIWQSHKIKPLFNKKLNFYLSYGLTAIGLLLMIYTIRHLPLIDFRAYAVGKNIPEGMVIPEGAPQPKFKEIWHYKVNGEVKEFSSEEEPWNIEGAEFIDRKTIVLREGYTPPIHDFSIENDTDGDITDKVLVAPEIYLIISYEPEAVTPEAQKITNQYAQKLKKEGKQVIGMFSTYDEHIASQYNFPIYLTDATTLKTMIRSNPGLIKLKNGTITLKKAWRDLQ